MEATTHRQHLGAPEVILSRILPEKLQGLMGKMRNLTHRSRSSSYCWSLCVCGRGVGVGGCWDGTQGSVRAKQDFSTEVHPQPLAF